MLRCAARERAAREVGLTLCPSLVVMSSAPVLLFFVISSGLFNNILLLTDEGSEFISCKHIAAIRNDR